MPILGIIASGISGHLTPAYDPSAYDALASVTLSATTANVVFAGIPSGYKHLQVRAITKTDGAGNGYSMVATVNGDTTTANYYSHYLLGDGASASAGSYQTTGGVYIIGSTTGAGTDSYWFSPFVLDILDYSSVNKNKTFRYLTGQDRNGAGSVTFGSGFWNNTSAITSLNFFVNGGNFVANTQLALYGVK